MSKPATFKRITKAEARKRFDDSLPFVMCPSKMRPGHPFGMHSTIFPAAHKPEGYPELWDTFDQVYNNWAYYNATHETGYYAHYYIEEPVMSKPQLANPMANLTRIDAFGHTLWFSYDVLVAFVAEGHGLIVVVNRWGTSTARHLNLIDGGKRAERKPKYEFDTLVEEVFS